MVRYGFTRGCNEVEIANLERRYDIRFPPSYREFLRVAGRGGLNDFAVGSDYQYEELDDLQDCAHQLVAEAGLASLPPGSFAFFMHQGYQFFFPEWRTSLLLSRGKWRGETGVRDIRGLVSHGDQMVSVSPLTSSP